MSAWALFWAVTVVVSLYLGYMIGRAVECSSQADKRRGWK